MDILYYWKNFASDIKEGRLGSLGSNDDKLSDIVRVRKPNRVWTVITPGSMKGNLQLIGRLNIIDDEPDEHVQSWPHNVFYDVESAKSVLFTDTLEPARIKAVTDFFNIRFYPAFKANFRGPQGIQEVEMDSVRALDRLVQDFPQVQFLEGIGRR